jgi:4-hydroxy-3-methylbut-2-enyl diphosphate reductase
MKQFDIPTFYRSPIISKLKEKRKADDPRKKDFSPALLDFGPVRFIVPRHFGFCYGVENAIEIAYKAVDENPGKRIFLLSQMIHNPAVNADLEARGIQFIMDTKGNQFIPWDELKEEDVVIIPAFGTTVEIEGLLKAKSIEVKEYNTTCPFVEKVWNRSKKLGDDNYTIIIHGKPIHEETRATFSHAKESAASIVVKDIEESRWLGEYMLGKHSDEVFEQKFRERCSEGFNPKNDLNRVGVVNQTTMLASETQSIADFFKEIMLAKYGEENIKEHFADTRDTLCYATNDNQQSTFGLLEHKADVALVIGGYNSSNTSHLLELLEDKFQSYFIKDENEILSKNEIQHFDLHSKELKKSPFLSDKEPIKIIISSGASCPDSVVDRVMMKVLSYYDGVKNVEEII